MSNSSSSHSLRVLCEFSRTDSEKQALHTVALPVTMRLKSGRSTSRDSFGVIIECCLAQSDLEELVLMDYNMLLALLSSLTGHGVLPLIGKLKIDCIEGDKLELSKSSTSSHETPLTSDDTKRSS